jgi:chromosomal replication initiator protein
MYACSLFSATEEGRARKKGGEVTTDDREIVSALHEALADKVGKRRYGLWFGASTRLALDGDRLRIAAPNQCFLDWIRSAFRGPIEEACRAVLGRCPPLEFHLDPQKAESSPASMTDGKSDQSRGATHDAAPAVLPIRAAAEPAPVPSGRGEPTCRDAGRKLAAFETFVVGEGNRLALTAAQMILRQPGQISPLLIYGPTSIGKTHLLESIFAAARQTARQLSAVSLSAEQFTTHFLEALRGSGLPNFRRKYRGVGLLIVDDLQFFVGKRATQVELLHTLDTLLRERRQLVFAADRPPAELAELGPELTTRLSGGLVCRIDPPDFATRRGIVAQLAQRMNLSLPQDVQEYVAAQLTRHARELSGALCRLQATSEALGKPITLALAEEALGDLIRHNGRSVRLGDIEKAVCESFGLDAACLQADDKSKRVSHPRMLAMWLARKHTRAALSEIGRYFGRRSHSTVVSAQKQIDRWMASGRQVQLAERAWPIDDAIRHVERRLAAG